jgi:hypothetical protein
MRTLLAVTLVFVCCAQAQARSHTCPPVAHNERTVAASVACWRVSELALGAKEQLRKVHWHGQEFALYGFRCEAVDTFYSNGQLFVSTWHFSCYRSVREYANFWWRFRQ